MAKPPTMSDSFDSAMRSSKLEGDEARFMAPKPKPRPKRPSIEESVDSGNRASKLEGAEMRKMGIKKMAKGGSTASKRADGCATKGKTKGRFV